MDDTDRLVAAIIAATMGFKRNVAKAEEFINYYEIVLAELRKREKPAAAAAAAAPTAPAEAPPEH